MHSDDKLTGIFFDYTLWKCCLTDLNSCERLEQSKLDSMYFVISYASVGMRSVYREKGERCSSQPADECPKYVTYEKDNTHLKLSVSRDGKLIDTDGNLFDTLEASKAPDGMRAAIFVMDNGGSIFASNHHKHNKYNHSSLMAGKPVSSAGFLQVSKGVIKFVNSCSNHYKVPAEIAEQFLDSLYMQGYNASVVKMVYSCVKTSA